MNCLECSDSSTCTKCDKTMYLNPLMHSCGIDCPKGYIKNENNSVCDPCSIAMPGCQTCISTAVCTECYVRFLDYNTNQCMKKYPTPRYISYEATFTCVECKVMFPHCTECTSNGTECLKCGNESPYLLSSKQGCTTSCNLFDSGTFLENNKCIKCKERMTSCIFCKNSTTCI